MCEKCQTYDEILTGMKSLHSPIGYNFIVISIETTYPYTDWDFMPFLDLNGNIIEPKITEGC